MTLMSEYYQPINRRDDFDMYYEDLSGWLVFKFLRRSLEPWLAHLYIVRNASVVHIPFSGGPLGTTMVWKLEAPLYRLAGVRTVILPYGADVYTYSRVPDPAVRHALLLSYPMAARREEEIAERVKYWVREADVIAMGYTTEGVGRWDVLVGNMVCIDTDTWQGRKTYSTHDGRSGVAKVLHAPNHKGVKGSDFLVAAVEALRKEGLRVELILVERVPNERIRELMHEVDILADQFLLPGYGMHTIEGMASGLPVLANLEDEMYTRIFRRFSFLNECPILSTAPENLKENLRYLIKHPRLRECLGRAGRQFVEKYHSYETAQYLFGSIYEKLRGRGDVDLMNLFHPLRSEFVKRSARVSQPLVENRLPRGWIAYKDMPCAPATSDATAGNRRDPS